MTNLTISNDRICSKFFFFSQFSLNSIQNQVSLICENQSPFIAETKETSSEQPLSFPFQMSTRVHLCLYKTSTWRKSCSKLMAEAAMWRYKLFIWSICWRLKSVEWKESSLSCLDKTNFIYDPMWVSMLKFLLLPLPWISHRFWKSAIAHSSVHPFLWFCIITSSIHHPFLIFDFSILVLLCFWVPCPLLHSISLFLLFWIFKFITPNLFIFAIEAQLIFFFLKHPTTNN